MRKYKFTDEDIEGWAKYLRQGAPNRPNKEAVLSHTADMLDQLLIDRAFLRVEVQLLRKEKQT